MDLVKLGLIQIACHYIKRTLMQARHILLISIFLVMFFMLRYLIYSLIKETSLLLFKFLRLLLSLDAHRPHLLPSCLLDLHYGLNRTWIRFLLLFFLLFFY